VPIYLSVAHPAGAQVHTNGVVLFNATPLNARASDSQINASISKVMFATMELVGMMSVYTYVSSDSPTLDNVLAWHGRGRTE
jgi:hypothetical protein